MNTHRQRVAKSVRKRALALAIVLTFAQFLPGCRKGGESAATDVDQSCNGSETSVDLPDAAGAGLVVQVKRDSSCPVKVSGLSNFDGHVQPGNVVVRAQKGGGTVKLACDGSDAEKKCKFSYLKLTRPREAATLAEETVSTKCDKGDTVLDLLGGNYSIEVQVNDSSKCPVTVSGVNASSDTVEIGKTQSFNKQLNVTESAEIKLSCGGATDKGCSYHYILKKN